MLKFVDKLYGGLTKLEEHEKFKIVKKKLKNSAWLGRFCHIVAGLSWFMLVMHWSEAGHVLV